MAKYRKKPVVIEAVLWDGQNEAEVTDLSDETDYVFDYFADNPTKLRIRTLEGLMGAMAGDYIIRGVDGEVYPCKPHVFHQTYEEVGKVGRSRKPVEGQKGRLSNDV